MGKIITIAHQKGGVGKSTLALNLAVCFLDDLRVALVDTDLQGSLDQMKDELSGITVLNCADPKELTNLDFDLIIVDTPPYLSNKLPELFEVADFVLIPTKPGFFDVRAIRSTIALFKAAEARKPHLKAGIALNMVKPRSGITNEVYGLLKDMGIPIFKTFIHDRVSIARSSMTSGILNSSDAKAKDEITALAEEIVNEVLN